MIILKISSIVIAATILFLLGGTFLLGSHSCGKEIERLRKQNAAFRARLVQVSSTTPIPSPTKSSCRPPPLTSSSPSPQVPARRPLCELTEEQAEPLPVEYWTGNPDELGDTSDDLHLRWTYQVTTMAPKSDVKKTLYVPLIMWHDDLHLKNQTYVRELYVALASVACKWHGRLLGSATAVNE